MHKRFQCRAIQQVSNCLRSFKLFVNVVVDDQSENQDYSTFINLVQLLVSVSARAFLAEGGSVLILEPELDPLERDLVPVLLDLKLDLLVNFSKSVPLPVIVCGTESA